MSDRSKRIEGDVNATPGTSPERPLSSPGDTSHRERVENRSVGVWEEDWSLIKDMVEQLKTDGVTDWYRHFTLHGDQLDRAYRLATMRSVDQTALDIYRAPNIQAVIDMTFIENIPPEDVLEFKNNLVAFIEGRTCYEAESKELTFDDREITTRRVTTLPPGHQTSWSCVRYTIEDISKSTRMEVSLRESEARYREIFDEGPAALWVEDWSAVKKMIDGLNDEGVENWRAYFGDHRDRAVEAYDLAEVLEISNANLELYGAANAREFAESIQAEIALPEELDAFIEVVLGFLEGHWKPDIKSWDAKMDGSKIMVRTRGIVPPAHRQDWSRLIYSLEDVTEQTRAEEALRESEAQLRNMAANVPGAVYQRARAPDGTISFPYVSARVRDIHGFEAEEIMRDANVLLDAIHPDYVDAFRASLEHSAKKLEPTSLEYKLIVRSGERRWVRAGARPRRLEDGTVIWDGILFDITEQKRAEAALRKSQIVLDEA